MKKANPTHKCLAIILPLLICLGCSALHEKGKIPKCKSFFGLVEEYWHPDPATGLYPMRLGNRNGLDHSILECGECLEGLPRRDFERLFGKADTTWGNHLAYYLTEPCNSKRGANADGCYYLECILDQSQAVKGVGIAMDQAISDPKSR